MEYVPNLTIILSMWIILLVHKPESINGQMPFACSPAYCAAYGKCPEFSCKAKNEIVLKNVTQCGCCHRCVTEKGWFIYLVIFFSFNQLCFTIDFFILLT